MGECSSIIRPKVREGFEVINDDSSTNNSSGMWSVDR